MIERAFCDREYDRKALSGSPYLSEMPWKSIARYQKIQKEFSLTVEGFSGLSLPNRIWDSHSLLELLNPDPPTLAFLVLFIFLLLSSFVAQFLFFCAFLPSFSRDSGGSAKRRTLVFVQFVSWFFLPQNQEPKKGIYIKNFVRSPPPKTSQGTPDPANSLCLGPISPSKYRKKAYIKNFRGGGS